MPPMAGSGCPRSSGWTAEPHECSRHRRRRSRRHHHRRRGGRDPSRRHRRSRRRHPRLQPRHRRRGSCRRRRHRRRRGRRARSRSAGRCARGAQGQHVHPGHPDHVLVEDPRGLAPALRRHRGRAAPHRRRDSRGQDQPRRVRDGFEHRELGVRAHPQPARPHPGAGWLQWWLGRRRGRRLRPGGAGQRHRRLDPSARRALRRGRRQAHLRTGQPVRVGGFRQQPRPDRPVHDDRGRRRTGHRSHRRARSA